MVDILRPHENGADGAFAGCGAGVVQASFEGGNGYDHQIVGCAALVEYADHLKDNIADADGLSERISTVKQIVGRWSCR